MDLQSIRFFVTTADAGSFSAAAEELEYAQSNLSSRVKQLEEELGETLFYRHRKGVSLTVKGKLFYDYSVKLLQLLEDAVNTVKNMDEPKGDLTIGSLEALILEDLPELLTAYHGMYNEVKLSLHTDMNTQLIELVRDRELDGAFIAGPALNAELMEVPFCVKNLVLVGSSKGEPLLVGTILAEAPIITFPEGSVFRKRLELLLASHSAAFHNRFHEMNSLSANIANICAGIGYGYLPRTTVSTYIAQGLMREYDVNDPYSELNVSFIYRRDRIMNAAFLRFPESIRGYQKKKNRSIRIPSAIL